MSRIFKKERDGSLTINLSAINPFSSRGRKPIKESSMVSMGYDPDRSHSDYKYYRPLTGSSAYGDYITQQSLERIIRDSRYLCLVNGIAKRALSLVVEYALGIGYEPKSTEESLADFLKEYWYGYNQWNLRQYEIFLSLLRDGALPFYAHTNDIGLVSYSWIDPLTIKTVLSEAEVDPNGGHPDRAGKIILKDGAEIKLSKGKSLKELDIIRPVYDPAIKGNKLEGNAFYFTINTPAGSLVGIPELLPVQDWLAHIDYTLLQLVENSAIQNSFVWDVLFKNLDESEIKEKLETEFPEKFKPGMIWGHNDDIQMKPAEKSHKDSYGAAKYVEILMEHVLGALGLPRHWYAHGGDVNRATATEMGDPTYQRLAYHQRVYKGMHTQMIDYAIQQALGKSLRVTDENAYDIATASIDTKDVTKLTATAVQLGASLSLAVQNKWISNEDAASVYVGTLQPLGSEIEPLTEKDIEKAEKEKEKKKQREIEPDEVIDELDIPEEQKEAYRRFRGLVAQHNRNRREHLMNEARKPVLRAG